MHHKSDSLPNYITAALLLADGTVFYGQGIGAKGTTIGEICFNTGLTGYQETLCDPSYAGQIITFTFPHIGNVGTNDDDFESKKPAVKGLVIRNAITSPSNFRSTASLSDWLTSNHIIGISGIDTRALVHHIRHRGAQNALIIHFDKHNHFNRESLIAQLQAYPSLKGMELAKSVTCKKPYTWDESTWALDSGHQKKTIDKANSFHVVAIDYGCKLNILRCLTQFNCRVTVVPSTTKAKDILALKPDGIFLSNGPGDPKATGEYAIETLKTLIDENIPIFGICLGHQLLALALGCSTVKMDQGHRGSNHPVHHLEKGNIEITSQNHGFVVDKHSIPPYVEITHISLFDHSIEGIKLKNKPVFSVQYHPESSPGPHDSQYLFEMFITNMSHYKNKIRT